MKPKTLAGSAILGALVVVFDYTMKFSGLKIPFPWLPFLKFDFTGVPIVLSLLFFGLIPGAYTSAIAFLAILLRSGDVVGASMKALAEFATIAGMALSYRLRANPKRFSQVSASILGITSRFSIMFFANLVTLPIFYKIPQPTVLGMSPLIAGFNAVHAALSIFLGYFLYKTSCSALRKKELSP